MKPWLGFFYMPLWLDYYILDIDTKDYSYLVASSPATSGFGAWMYIMTRQVSSSSLWPLYLSMQHSLTQTRSLLFAVAYISICDLYIYLWPIYLSMHA